MLRESVCVCVCMHAGWGMGVSVHLEPNPDHLRNWLTHSHHRRPFHRTPQVAVPGGSAEPVDRSVTQPCNLLGCKTCLEGTDSRICQQCEDSWQLTPQGSCECAAGSGTFVTTAFETSLPYPDFSGTQPSDTCLYRIDNPRYLSPLRQAEHCSGANPRVIQHFFVNPPECQCRLCPAGWTSSGGPPKVAFCYPTVLPRYVKLEIEVATPNNYSRYDFTPSSTAESVLDAFAHAMVASDVKRYGTTVLLPPTGPPLQDSYFGVQPQEISVYAATYTFNGTEADLAFLVNAALSCRALGTPSGCASCRWDLCGVFNITAPSSVLYQLGIVSIPTSMFNVPPALVRGQVDAQCSSRWCIHGLHRATHSHARTPKPNQLRCNRTPSTIRTPWSSPRSDGAGLSTISKLGRTRCHLPKRSFP